MIEHYHKHGPWVWCCHLDLTNPNPVLWDYLKPFVGKYDAVLLSLPEYAQRLAAPQNTRSVT